MAIKILCDISSLVELMTYRYGFLNVVGLRLAKLTGLVMKAQHHLEGAFSVKKCYITVKPVYNDHLYNKMYPLWLIQ